MYVRIQEQRSKCDKWHATVCPNIFKKLQGNIKRTQFCEVLWNGKDGFEVKHLTGRGRRYTVNLERKTCSCGYLQLAGLPCCHAICAIYKSGRKIEEFIHPCYYIETFKKIYEHCLQPVEGEKCWPVSPDFQENNLLPVRQIFGPIFQSFSRSLELSCKDLGTVTCLNLL